LFISIPTGAIKRITRLLLGVLALYISIPTGAIKSGRSCRNLQYRNPFQFLLVRLKAGKCPARQCLFLLISIPTGAIKSFFYFFIFLYPFLISIPTGAIKSFYFCN